MWLLFLSGTLTLSGPTDIACAPYGGEHAVERIEGIDMAQGLTSNQEIVEVRLDNFMGGSIKNALTQELAARPGIASLPYPL